MGSTGRPLTIHFDTTFTFGAVEVFANSPELRSITRHHSSMNINNRNGNHMTKKSHRDIGLNVKTAEFLTHRARSMVSVAILST